MKNKVAIIGYGYVGKGMARIFPDALVYDPSFNVQDDEFKIVDGVIVAGKNVINAQAGLAIVCVPTPPKDQSSQFAEDVDVPLEADTSIVEATIQWLSDVPFILVKSTVPPGTTDRINGTLTTKKVCFSPEYMGEGGYYTPPHYPDPKDPVKHDFMVIGGEKETCEGVLAYFIPKLGPSKTYYVVTAIEAELIKYMENTWGAMKVTFCNEWFDICQKFGASYERVREGWLLDSRVERMHTAIFRNKRGFGGKCYPKDLMAIIKASENAGYEPKILKQVFEANKDMRKKSL